MRKKVTFLVTYANTFSPDLIIVGGGRSGSILWAVLGSKRTLRSDISHVFMNTSYH
jgi:hypothetical protein